MSVYSVKGKGWRYDFILKGQRYTSNWFTTKKAARQAEAKKREEVKTGEVGTKKREEVTNPPADPRRPKLETTPTAMAFLNLVNKRLDHIQAYNSRSYYHTNVGLARRWVKYWGKLRCDQLTRDMVERFVLARRKVSAFAANKEIRYLKAAFNFGLKKGLVTRNPVSGLTFLPEEKRLKYIPPLGDIDKVIALATPETQDYLWTIRDTLARVSEVNRLTWDDVNLEQRYVVLYTRKKRGGHLTPRKVPLTDRLLGILSRRYEERDHTKPWVFWHWYRPKANGVREAGPYEDRRESLKSLAIKAGVRHFGFHALRHAGASLMDSVNVPLGSIQRILGHEHRSTTEIYLHSLGELEREAMAIYEQVSGGSVPVSHNSHITDPIGTNSHIKSRTKNVAGPKPNGLGPA
jgi:integrase